MVLAALDAATEYRGRKDERWIEWELGGVFDVSEMVVLTFEFEGLCRGGLCRGGLRETGVFS